jgi:large repetitive protein
VVPRGRVLLVVAAIALGASGAGLAAALSVTSSKLTTSTGAASISATTCTLSAASADSYVNEASASTNSGTATTLEVRSASAGDRRTFVQFSLASCAIPANALVTAASLKLYMNSAPTASRTYEARAVSASWTETGITWTNQPAVSGSITSSVSTGTTSNVTLTWTITADVQAFLDGTTTNSGWRVGDATENSATARSAQFRSDEYTTAAQRPVLEVTYYP